MEVVWMIEFMTRQVKNLAVGLENGQRYPQITKRVPQNLNFCPRTPVADSTHPQAGLHMREQLAREFGRVVSRHTSHKEKLLALPFYLT